MTRRRYISVEELIWRELGDFLPKDVLDDVNTRSSNTEKSLRLTTGCILGRLASRKNKRDFSASETLSCVSPSLPSRLSFPLIALLPLLSVATGTVLSRNNDSYGPLPSPPKPLARVNLAKRPRGKSIDRDVIVATQ